MTRELRGGGGFAARKWWGLRVFSTTERGRLRFFSRPDSPNAPGRSGVAWALRMDLGFFFGEKRETGDTAGPNNAVRMKKRMPGASSRRRLEVLLVKEAADPETSRLYQRLCLVL
jgi:hypothetical protein